MAKFTLLLLLGLSLAVIVTAGVHDDHSGHDHETDDDHSDHHDHAGKPHGHGTTNEDCDADDTNHDHDHGSHDADHAHDGHDHHDHDHHGHTDDENSKPGKCPDTKHVFDGEKRYLDVMSSGPELNDFTFCTFATTDSKGVLSGVIGSINHDKPLQNVVVLGAKERKNTVVRIVFQGQTRKINTVPLGFNNEVHLCMVTSSAKNQIMIFLNGKQTRALKFKSIKAIPKGGRITVGKMSGDKFPMYTGTLRNFMMWRKPLTEAQIMKIYKSNDCPGGELVTLTEMNTIPMVANVKTEACEDKEYTLDNTGSEVEYLELAGTVPELKFVTICVHVTTDAKGSIPGTIASYATKSNPKMIVVGGVMDGSMPMIRVEVNGEVKTLPGKLHPKTKYCLCMEYHLTHGHLMTYINGQLSRMIMFKYASPLPANGIIIVGQRQTKLGGCLDKSLAFTGKVQGFTIWGRVLSKSEMEAFCAGTCPIDALVKSGPSDIVPSGTVFTSSPCPSYEHTLDNTGNKVEYIQILTTFMKSYDYMTMCAKITSDSFGMLPGAVGSYSTKAMIDALYLGGEKKDGKPHMRVTVNGMSTLTFAPFSPNTEYFNCVSFHIPHGHVLTYLNGNLASDLDFHANSKNIPAGGTLILGQKQGSFGGGFDRSKAFNGKIGSFMIWDRVLSVAEMTAMANKNLCPSGAIIDMSPSMAKKISTTT